MLSHIILVYSYEYVMNSSEISFANRYRDVKGSHQSHLEDIKENGTTVNGYMPPSDWSDDENSPDPPKAKRFRVRVFYLLLLIIRNIY